VEEMMKFIIENRDPTEYRNSFNFVPFFEEHQEAIHSMIANYTGSYVAQYYTESKLKDGFFQNLSELEGVELRRLLLSLNFDYKECCTGLIVGETAGESYKRRWSEYHGFRGNKRVAQYAKQVKEILKPHDIQLLCVFIPTYSALSTEEGLIGEILTEGLLRSATYLGRPSKAASVVCQKKKNS